MTTPQVRAELLRGPRHQDLRRPLQPVPRRDGGDPGDKPEDKLRMLGHRRGLQGAVRVHRVPEAVLGQPLRR